MKTPYMNIKENQGFMIILIIVLAFLILNCICSDALAYQQDLVMTARESQSSPVSAATVTITSQPIPLNESINSQFVELKPVMAPCGNRLYFSRLEYFDKITNCGKDEDIWYTDYNAATNSWSSPQRVTGEINNSGPNFVNSLSPKGDTLVLGNRYRRGKMLAGLSYSVKVEGQWSAPQNITIRNDYNISDHANHYVSFQHHVIISAIERAETVGERDLYVSFWDGGTATEPMNLGLVVNTDLEESSPYLSPDGKTLFFASKGHGGFGGYDIYMTTRLDDTWTTWSKPVNLGPAVNTANDEEHFSITRCGKYGLFSREINDHNVDLFRVGLVVSEPAKVPNLIPVNQSVVPSFASL